MFWQQQDVSLEKWEGLESSRYGSDPVFVVHISQSSIFNAKNEGWLRETLSRPFQIGWVDEKHPTSSGCCCAQIWAFLNVDEAKPPTTKISWKPSRINGENMYGKPCFVRRFPQKIFGPPTSTWSSEQFKQHRSLMKAIESRLVKEKWTHFMDDFVIQNSIYMPQSKQFLFNQSLLTKTKIIAALKQQGPKSQFCSLDPGLYPIGFHKTGIFTYIDPIKINHSCRWNIPVP